MSKTLFWYVFKDLLKIFVMTSLVLAGIMSFGGLLKPMMQYGLNGSQMAEMLVYLLPAMQTYSLPIAALFATTVVYGRLAADNELTACRAGGISYTSMIIPALVLALILSIVSLLCLSFIVPRYTLKVERVAFDSLAEVVKKRLERKHQIKLGEYEIYADSVDILPPPPNRPNDEVIVLNGPVFCNFPRDEKVRRTQPIPIPAEFYTARRAIAVIHRDDDDVKFTAQLEGGAMFPREFKGATLGGIETVDFGPIEVESPIRENTKFMDVRQLKELYHYPMRSRQVRTLYNRITKDEQDFEFINNVRNTLNRTAQFRFQSGNESYLLTLDPEIKTNEQEAFNKVVISSIPGSQNRQIRLQHIQDGQTISSDEAKQLTLIVNSDTQNDRIKLTFRLVDVLVGARPMNELQGSLPEPQQGRSGRTSFECSFNIPMPLQLAAYKTLGPEHYLTKGNVHSKNLRDLREELAGLQGNIVGEIHGRVSFAVSCLILVVVGCALGMMFKTGNYLGAFALSVIPALLCIALMVTGQHVIDNESRLLKLGLATIWSGNLIVLTLATTLLAHLRRQ